METRRLGKTDLHITRVGVGAWAMGGGGWKFGWGPQDDAASVAAIHAALDAGINWIDTAAVYGLGHAEEVVAQALAGMAQPPLVFTKCGRVWDDARSIGKCLLEASIRRECEASLRRLKTDRIDLYQIHWPEPDEQIEAGWATLLKLQAEGKVRHIGVSNFNAGQLARAEALGPVATLQPHYSLLNRGIEAETLPFCARHGIGTLAYSPMGSGLLTGAMTRERIASLPEDDWRRHNPNYREPLLTANLALVERLRTVAARHGKTPADAAVAWVLGHPAMTAAIVGMRNPAQARAALGGVGWTLSAEDRRFLEQPS